MGCSLFADTNITDLLQGEHPEIWSQSDPPPVDLSVGDIRSQIAAEWLQIAQRSQRRAYRKPPSLFRMVPSLIPFDLPSPQNGVPYARKIRELPYIRNRSSDPLHVWFYGGVFGDGGSNGAIFSSNKSKMVAAAILDNFEWPYLRNSSYRTIDLYRPAHRTVMVAIAQLSCSGLCLVSVWSVFLICLLSCTFSMNQHELHCIIVLMYH